jgi:hypothetical protein
VDHIVLGRIAAEAGLTEIATREGQIAMSSPDDSVHSTAKLARRWRWELSRWRRQHHQTWMPPSQHRLVP